jgi:predicted MFS family arabinose efflux permease
MNLETQTNPQKEKVFTPYQILMIVVLTFIQFTVILDFMVLSPLGAILMPELKINPAQFGLVVSAYAFSAGISGLLAAGFADKFDRKKLLLFFYTGFLIGTAFCASASTYEELLVARIVTGIFGGVLASIAFAIITDVFKMEVRGRVMGFIQTAFAASQILGLPIGLYLANHLGWHSTFWMIVILGIIAGIIMLIKIQPINEHLKIKSDRNPFHHLYITLTNTFYLRAFLGTTLLATGGFMLMPFGSDYSINNLGLTRDQLPYLYGITGVFSILFAPLSGKMSDKYGQFQVFVVGTVISIAMVGIYCNIGITPLWICIALNVVLFAGITARMISSSSLITAIPQPQDRGAFMSINSSVQQISGGVAAF